MVGKCDKICLILMVNIGYFYMMDKNKKNIFGKMEFLKYDLVVCKYVLYKEGKIK